MTTTSPDLRDLATAAVDHRAGRDLYRFRITDGLSREVDDVTQLAKEPDGSVIVPGVDVLKVGTFNGLSLVDGDLEAMVERFELLREGVFVPPLRLDHSWSILSVIGWWERLETYRRLDESDGIEKLFLRGDVRVTGSLDIGVDTVLGAIKRGALRPRSSELGYYQTNAGLELPLVFYGAAFVDIPAVEGLAPVKLSRPAPEPHSIVNLHSEGTPNVSEQTPEQAPDEQTETPEGVEAPEETPEGGQEAPEQTPEDEGTGEDTPSPEEPAEEPGDGDGEEPAEEPGEEQPADDGGASAELAAARAEITRLRQERADEQLAAFKASGRVVPATEQAARTLLSHDSDDVRRAAGTILGNVAPPVALDRRSGRRTHDLTASAGGDGEVIRLGMTAEEVGDLWSSLSTEERKAHRDEYDAWQRDRRENGIRD